MMWWKPKHKHVLRAGAFSDVGQVRSENQDAYGCFHSPANGTGEERLFVVADGMGGHAHGREASRLAVEALQQTYFSERGAVGQRLRRAVEAANERIYAQAQQNPVQEKMGTTCTALAFVDGLVHLAHVGDSRAYRIDRSGIEQLSRDHTLVEELRLQGVLTEAEARQHPRRHALTRALGIRPTLEVDVLEGRPLHTQEWYLLCSDGLALVTPEEIRQVVLGRPPQDACEHLVQLTNRRGGPDNVTVVLVAVE